MSNEIIAVDVDEVLLPHFQGLIDWYNHEYSTKLTLAHNHPEDPRPWGVNSVDAAVRRVQRYFDTTNFSREQPFTDACPSLKVLYGHYELVVITARGEIIEEATRRWLDEYFKGLFTAEYFTDQYSLEGKKQSKIAVAQAVKADYLIDDSLPIVTEAAKSGIKSILFGDYVWNQAPKLPLNVTRCKNWGEVLEYFDDKS